MDAKISELLNYTTPKLYDILAIVDVDNGITKKVTVSALLQGSDNSYLKLDGTNSSSLAPLTLNQEFNLNSVNTNGFSADIFLNPVTSMSGRFNGSGTVMRSYAGGTISSPSVEGAVVTSPGGAYLQSYAATGGINVRIRATQGGISFEKNLLGVTVDVNSIATSYTAVLPNKTGTQTFAMISDLSGLGSGTVTSVGITGTDFSITGSPVTTSGNIGLTLVNVNSNIGTFNNVTVNAKGLVTAASNVAYLTGNQSISLTGEATGSGTTSIGVTLTNSAVIGKVLTGYASGAGTVTATDSILQAIQKLNGNSLQKWSVLGNAGSGLLLGTTSNNTWDLIANGLTVCRVENSPTGTPNSYVFFRNGDNTLTGDASSPIIYSSSGSLRLKGAISGSALSIVSNGLSWINGGSAAPMQFNSGTVTYPIAGAVYSGTFNTASSTVINITGAVTQNNISIAYAGYGFTASVSQTGTSSGTIFGVNVAPSSLSMSASGTFSAFRTNINDSTGVYAFRSEGTASSEHGGHIKITTAGRGLFIKEGSNAKMGTATLSGGSVVVNTTAVTANSRIFLTAQETGTYMGSLRVSARVSGTSFTISTAGGLDNAVVAWHIIEPS